MASLFFYDLLPPFPADPLDVQINSLPSGHVSFFFFVVVCWPGRSHIFCADHSVIAGCRKSRPDLPKKTKDFAVLGAFFAGAALR